MLESSELELLGLFELVGDIFLALDLVESTSDLRIRSFVRIEMIELDV